MLCSHQLNDWKPCSGLHNHAFLSRKRCYHKEDNIWNKLLVDVMFLCNTSCHVVGTAASFTAATFLDSNKSEYGQSVNGVWLEFVTTCSYIYKGYHNWLRNIKAMFLFPNDGNSWKIRLNSTTTVHLWLKAFRHCRKTPWSIWKTLSENWDYVPCGCS